MAEPVKVTVEDENGHATEFVPTHSIVALSVAPTSETLAPNQTRQLIVTCTLGNRTREDCTTHVDTSYSSNNLAVATVTAGGLVQVIATAAVGASATIMVMHQGFMANYSVTVSGVLPPKVMTSITVTPDSDTLNVGDLRQLKATCLFNDGTSEDCTTESAWTSANPGVATVSPNGGLVTGKAAGNAVIEARHSGFMDSSSFTITAVPDDNLPDPPAGAIFITGNQPNGINISSGHYVISGLVTCPAKSVVVTGTATLWGRTKYKSDLYVPGIDNSKFRTDGAFAPDTDIGLWVEGAGSVDFRGTPKKAWGYGLKSDPSWQLGDEIVECPLTFAEIGPNGFKSYTPGNALRTMPNGDLLPVLNLTRSIKIRGEPGKWGHYRNTSTAPSFLDYTEMSWFGFDRMGRYSIHHHMRHDTSRGTVHKGLVVKHSGAHAFVSHHSDGITWEDCIAYDIQNDPFWYDQTVGKLSDNPGPSSDTNDLHYVRCVAAWTHDDSSRHSGYLLARSLFGNKVEDCLAVGIDIGRFGNSSGYHWSEGDSNAERPGFWEFNNNVALACANWGIFTWQNSGPAPHTVASKGKFTAINCGRGLTGDNTGGGISHGAYATAYEYRDCEIYNLPGTIGVQIFAVSRKTVPPRPDGYGECFERFKIRGGLHGIHMAHHVLTSNTPVLIKDFDIQGTSGKKVLWSELQSGTSQKCLWDIVNPATPGLGNILPADIDRVAPAVGSVIRIQQGTQAWRITHTGAVTSISPFYPPVSSFPADSWDLDPALDPDPDHHI